MAPPPLPTAGTFTVAEDEALVLGRKLAPPQELPVAETWTRPEPLSVMLTVKLWPLATV